MKRFLVIGLGSIGRRHTRNLAALHPTAAFTFLRRNGTPDPLINDLGGQIVTTLPSNLSTFDLIVLATPSALHIDLLPALIDSGTTLMVEKPIVTTLTDCDALLARLADAPPATRVSGFNFRHVASLVTARKAIASGRIGRVIRASFTAGQWLPDWRPGQDYRTVYSARTELGGGVELDLVHEIDVARWLFGDLTLRHAICGHLSGLEINSNDVALMLLAPPGGGAPLVSVTLDYVSRQRVRRYEISGEAGTLIWDIDGTLEIRGPAKQTETLDESAGGFDIAASYVDMLDRTLAAAEGRSVRIQTLEDGISSSRLAIQARSEGYTP